MFNTKKMEQNVEAMEKKKAGHSARRVSYLL